MDVQPVDEQTAAHYSQVSQRLRAEGRPLPTNDLGSLLAPSNGDSHCLPHDGHFEQVDGLVSGALPEQLFL